MRRIFLNVDRDKLTNGIQLSIDEEDEDGGGVGYRIHGPKYCGQSESIIHHELTDSDIREIRYYLRRRKT